MACESRIRVRAATLQAGVPPLDGTAARESGLAQPPRPNLLLSDPELLRALGIVAPDLRDEPLGILAADDKPRASHRAGSRRQGVVDDGVDESLKRPYALATTLKAQHRV